MTIALLSRRSFLTGAKGAAAYEREKLRYYYAVRDTIRYH